MRVVITLFAMITLSIAASITNAISIEKSVEMNTIYDMESSVAENMKVVESQRQQHQTGIYLTNAMRKLHLDYEDDLVALDNRASYLKRQLSDLEKEKIYVRFAYECLKEFTETGCLNLTFIETKKGDVTRKARMYAFAKKVNEGFDETLFNQCIQKYGFSFGRIKFSRGYYGDTNKIDISLTLLSSTTENGASTKDPISHTCDDY